MLLIDTDHLVNFVSRQGLAIDDVETVAPNRLGGLPPVLALARPFFG
jgi:hypothetical protein